MRKKRRRKKKRGTLTRLMNGKSCGCLYAARCIGAQTLKDTRVDVQQAVYSQIVSVNSSDKSAKNKGPLLVILSVLLYI